MGIDFQLRTAPLYNEGFGSNATVGLEIISKTDLFEKAEYTLITNLGQGQTAVQRLPDQGVNIQNPLINIGADANYLQVDISGTTDAMSAIGFELYSMNLWSNKGGVR